MRHLVLFALLATFAAGCSSTDRYRSTRAYPASARVDGGGSQARYVICHKGKNTRTLPEAAIRAHLDHGDRFGACRGDRGRGNGNGNGRSPRRNQRNG